MPRKVDENLSANQEMLALLVLSEGMSVAKAARDPRISISVAQAYKWVQSDPYRRKIREILAETQIEVQSAARKRLNNAWATIDAALISPAVTPTMLAAARVVLQHAAGTPVQQEGGNVFHVEINTGLNPDAAEEQARRYQELRRPSALDVPFTVVE